MQASTTSNSKRSNMISIASSSPSSSASWTRLWALFVLILLLFSSTILFVNAATKTHSVVLETCGGWRLNRLPEIKKFIQEDAPKYSQLKVVYIGGVDPRLIFLDEQGQQLERLEISSMSRDTVRGVLAEHGLVRSSE